MIYYIILIFLGICGILEYFRPAYNENISLIQKYNLRVFNRLFYFSAGFLALIAAFRGEMGTDMASYMRLFRECLLITDITEERVEAGYIYLNRFFKHISNNYWLMQVCIVSFISIIYFKNFKSVSKYPIFTLFLYYIYYYHTHFFENIRQAIAMAILILGNKFIEEKKFYLWSFIVALAIQFHETAIIAFPLYWISKFKVTSPLIAISILIISVLINITGASFMVNLLGESIMQELILSDRLANLAEVYTSAESYSEGVSTSVITIIATIIKYSMYGLLIFLYFANKQHKVYDAVFTNFLVFMLVEAIGRGFIIFIRCSSYFALCGNALIIYNLLFEKDCFLWRKIKYAHISLIALFVLYNALTFHTHMNAKRPSGKSSLEYYTPYKTFLNK